PMARFGFIDRSVPTRWFTTTCFPGFFEAAAVVGMDGNLFGIGSCFAGNQSYQTAVDVFVANRDALIAGKNLDWLRYPPNPESVFHLGVSVRVRHMTAAGGTSSRPGFFFRARARARIG
ncbi:MAG: hypothetical protein KDA45_08830, partial [Planctomycetales bacterium]|nr:hypothetical protein [Planctomycetales bacterium]